MYEVFFGLKEKPFGIVPNPDYLYFSPRHKEALTFLEYGLMDNVGTILLTGEIGIGKTTLIRYMINNFCTDMVTPVIYNTNLNPEQLIETILQTLKLPTEKGNKSNNSETLNTYLLEQVEQKKRVLLIIDESQNLPFDTLEEVRMLSNLQTDDQMLLQVLLVGQPEFKTRIQQPELSQLAQRIAVNYHLEALDQAEVFSYIQHRLAVAGRDDKIFADNALMQIFQASKGIPRNINLICDAALVYGFGYEMKKIGTEVIDQVLVDKNKIGLECIQPLEHQPAVEIAGNTADSGLNKRAEALVVKHLKSFKAQIKELQHKDQRRFDWLTKRVDNIQSQLTHSLKELYQVERKRNERLLIHNQQLLQKYESHDKHDKKHKKHKKKEGQQFNVAPPVSQ